MRCVLVLSATSLIVVGCTSSTTELPAEKPRKQPKEVTFADEKPEPIPREQYLIRSREMGRPFSPESVADGLYTPPETSSTNSLHGPHPELVVELRAGEVAPLEDQGAAYVDPASGKVAWPAYTCMNADCGAQGKGGRPFLFVRKLDDITVEEDGRIVLGHAAGLKLLTAPTCPACNSNKWTGAYEPPEIAQRRVLLEAELAASRAARAKAKRAGETPPTDFRTPMEIMRDLSALPKLYLVAE